MKKAKVLGQLETSLDRVRALEETVARLESQRDADRVELTVADATIDAARARIAMLERTCENLTERIAMTERERDLRLAEREPVSQPQPQPDYEAIAERDRLIAELTEACELRAAAIDAAATAAAATADAERERDRFAAELLELASERDRLLVELGEARAACDEREAARSLLEVRLATIAQARERLFDASIRTAEERMRLERLAAERAEAIERFETERAELHAALERFEGRSAKLEYERDGANLRLAEIRADFDRLKARSLERDTALASAQERLERNGEIVQALTLAHRRAAEQLTSLQIECIRLEYEVASRVGAAEASASRAILAGSRLRDERALLIETLVLREKRIALLEGTLREIADEMLRTAQAERDRYVALHGGLLASKFVVVRDALVALFGRPRGLYARLRGRAARPPNKRRAALRRGKRRRHLRSA